MYNKHRIFIALNLPDNIKNNLTEYKDKWPELTGSVKWTKKDNIHITLIFLGYLNDEELVNVCKIAKKISEKHIPFLINLNKICYGPINRLPPRMIWAVGECPEELINLQNDLSKALRGPSSQEFSRDFSLHITLGRIRQFEWRRIEPEERPEIDEDINLNFEVNSIEIMESQLKKTGPQYTIIESYNL